MGMFEPYLDQFSQSVSWQDFLINLIVVSLLCTVLRIYYVRHGNAVSNRTRFGANFLPLGLTTMLIITIVKSSIALSLGLVGALSIVRFRAAIKDPEELIYLFLAISVGLAAGANQALIGLVAFVFIIGLLYLNKKVSGQPGFKREDKMYLNISTDIDDLPRITQLLSSHLPFIELKRMDKTDAVLEVSFIVKAKSIDDLNAVKNAVAALSPNTSISVIDQPDLVI